MPQHLQLVRATQRLQRRLFLKALALGMAAPAALRLAHTATAAPATAPKRFFLFYMPHGVPVEHYNPKVSDSDRSDFALDETNLSILRPLQKYRSHVNVYQGFKYPGGDTHDGIVNCLSGLPGKPDETRARTTLEHAIARSLGVKPLILGACSHIATNFDKNGKLFWDGTAVEPQKSPVVAADALFGGAASVPVSNVDAELRKDLLALTASEIQALQNSLGDLTAEKSKLARHLEAIQGIQNGQENRGASSCSGAPSLPHVDQVRAESAGNVVDPSGANDYFYQEANFPLLLQAQLELVAQALVCNVASVAALMPMFTSCDFNFNFTNVDAATPNGGWSHHSGLSHTGYRAVMGASETSPLSVNNFDPETRAAFAYAQRWFAEQLDTLVLQVLANTDDPAAPGSKVLDNTIVYWMSEIGDGSGHTTQTVVESPRVPAYLPLVSIGKGAGALKTGQVVRFDSDRPAADLYLTLAKAMGANDASFPETTGALTELLT
ncbi:MAG TPA: DUF1552 domain-containing protein [Polyangiaceae bacterium]|nr:DUF1552 domain-containing protein [Polyangiaceae bacterium]